MQRSFAVEPDGTTAVLDAPAETTSTAVVTQTHWNGGGGVEGEVDAGDIRLPRINIPQKSGDLGEKFAPGSIVFNKEILLTDGTTPLELTALRIRKQYQESLPYDPDGPTPKVFNTSAEVTANNGNFEYGEKGYYKEIAHILCVVPCPVGATEEQKDYFMFESQGASFAMAMWTVSGSAYTSVAKTLFTAAAGHLRAGLHTGKWAVTTEKRTRGGNTYFTPLIRSLGKNSPEDTAFAESLLG